MIFDFNGVLWWDELLQMQSWQEYSEKLRGYPVSDDEIRKYCLGRPNVDSFEIILNRSISQEEAAVLVQEKEKIYRDLCLAQGNNFQLSPGAEPLLNFLRSQRIPRTIATSSEINNVSFFIKQLNLQDWFEPEKIVFDDGSFPGKPAPQIYLRAAAILDLTPQECVVVEDSISGIEAAHAAGIGKLYALGPGANHDNLAAIPGVHGVISHLGEIPAAQLFGVDV